MLFEKNVRSVAGMLLAAIGLALHASSVNAEIVSPLNGSFESPATSGGYYYPLAPDNWSVAAGAGLSIVANNDSGSYASTTYGTQVCSLESTYGGAASGVQQNLGTMVAGEKYTFNAILFNNGGLVTSMGSDPCNYTISFYDVTKGKTLASITQANFDPSLGGTNTANSILAATFSYIAANAVNGDTLRLVMVSGVSSSSTFYRTGVDNVAVTTTAVPEPGTLTLLVTALAGLLAYAWRKR